MANELYIYTTPADSTVTLTLDLAGTIAGVPGTYNGRSDGHLLQIPAGTTPQGSLLTIAHDGFLTFENRGYLVPGEEAFWNCNDVHLMVAPPAPPIPPPTPSGNTPLEIINGVYASGNYDLSTKTGCGGFTEECCRQLAAKWGGPPWGHIAKSPGQNQYNAHAVDALSCLYGDDYGVWDIIYSSASADARPVCNRAGDPNPSEWRPPAPIPVQPVSAATMAADVQVTFTGSPEQIARLFTLVKTA